ncbi:GNAT family N-acetyltransferase [Alteromonas macleodii]|uniref:Acetyltransferase family protein n=1 Tax=Alteromonas macleodii TaxID=28108 RepID=A0AB36FTD0_ALTMA|nr:MULTISPECIES: GNAT family N-acetyltransferase [Alteromonas]OES30997.1 acetyltransferase family protein [Alteromonas macleodii]OES31407.1 acetyltransferase family protein [Alteromonas macleodii]OES31798.1 acetyltransferase family protein [Alteromonas macleodii]OES40797.1 acetyltransferase family protein [Alteromonas macleodii]OZB93143.1 ribosomal-protein-serine acetyltransferase [Alteromonas macleodii]
MIDLSILPSRLPPIHTEQGPISIQRIAEKHCYALCEAGQQSIHHVKPWFGSAVCPVTPALSKQCITNMEKARDTGYGLTYLLIHEEKCLGMGIINHIHHTHLTANLGYWLKPDACGKGLATAICEALKKLAFSQMNLHRLECFIEPNNKASIRVAERIGGTKEGLCRKRVFGRDALLYAIVNGD